MSSWNAILVDCEWDDNFSPRNLPYGVCVTTTTNSSPPFLATRVGAFVIKLANFQHPLLPIPQGAVDWGFLMKQPKLARVQFRTALAHCLFAQDSRLFHDQDFFRETCLPASQTRNLLPCVIGDYTDFYASRAHAENVGEMYRGKAAALQPNWLHLPVAYHGRSSSVVCSPSQVVRPWGQIGPAPGGGDAPPTFAATRKLDFELEVGIFVGGPENPQGTRVSVEEARHRIFGMVLLNDWSARDIQAWEYVPLGPFTAKNFCTTISPWIVPVEALEQSKAVPVGGIRQQHPVPLDYLVDDEYLLYDIDLFVGITAASQPLAHSNGKEVVVTKSNLRNLYWTPAQMIAHHTVTGCNLRPGDLLGSGTISGPDRGAFGSLLELTWNGTKGNGLFLQDGDRVRLFGHGKPGTGVGFGDCVGVVVPAGRGML